MREGVRKFLQGLDYAWRVLLAFVGSMLLLCGILGLFLVGYGAESTEDTVAFVSLLVVGILCLLPIIVKRYKRRRELRRTQMALAERTASSNLESQPEEAVEPQTVKGKIKKWWQTFLRVAYGSLAGLNLLVSIIFFLISEKEVGFFYLVAGVIFLALYLRKKRPQIRRVGQKINVGKLPDVRHKIRARARMFDEEMLGDDEQYTDHTIHTCLNCGCDYEGYYCPNCGQDRRKDIIDWHQLVIGMLSEAINFDGSTIRTLYELIRRPGVALRRYIGGQRERYSNPMKFGLFAGVFFTFMSIIFQPEISVTFNATGSKIYDAFRNFAGNIVVFQCLLAFVVDFFPLYWAFKSTEQGRKMSQVDFYIVMLYIIGVEFFLRACFCPLTHMSHLWNIVRFLIMFCFQFYVLKDLFRLRFWEMAGRYALRYLIYGVFASISLIPFIMLDLAATGGILDEWPMTEYVVSVMSGGLIVGF